MHEVVICNQSTAERTTEQKSAQPRDSFAFPYRSVTACNSNSRHKWISSEVHDHPCSTLCEFRSPCLDPPLDSAQCIKNSARKPFMLWMNDSWQHPLISLSSQPNKMADLSRGTRCIHIFSWWLSNRKWNLQNEIVRIGTISRKNPSKIAHEWKTMHFSIQDKLFLTSLPIFLTFSRFNVFSHGYFNPIAIFR
jgi:hypothetical protein